MAASETSSGSMPLSGTDSRPRCSNCQLTGANEPPAPGEDGPDLAAVRFLLSVMVATMTATLAGPRPSYVISSYCSASAPEPLARSIARFTFSDGMELARALSTAIRSR